MFMFFTFFVCLSAFCVDPKSIVDSTDIAARSAGGQTAEMLIKLEEELGAKIYRLREGNDQLSAQLAEKTKQTEENDRLKAKLQQLEEKTERMDEHNRLKAKLEQDLEELGRLSAQLERKNEEADWLRAKLEQDLEELSRLSAQLERKNEEADRLRAKLEQKKRAE